MVLAGGVGSLGDGQTESCLVERHLGNECRATAGGEHDRARKILPLQPSDRDQLRLQRSGDHPVTDGSAQYCHINLVEEVAERGIRWWSPQLQAHRFGEKGVAAVGATLQIRQALASAQDAQHSHQQQYQVGMRTPRHMRASGVDMR